MNNPVVSFINFLGASTNGMFNNYGVNLTAPTCFCVLGCKVLGVKTNYGLTQGVSAGIIHKFSLVPVNNFINRHAVEKIKFILTLLKC